MTFAAILTAVAAGVLFGSLCARVVNRRSR